MKVFIAFVLVLVGAVALTLFYFSSMPGESSPLSSVPLTEEEADIAERLQDECTMLAHQIGQRSTIKHSAVATARDYIRQRLIRSALRPTDVAFSSRGDQGVNVEAHSEGTLAKDEVLVIGAHYDTASYTPGADDNASGVAMLLQIARLVDAKQHDRTIAFVFFDRGSTRFASTQDTGSHAWATKAKQENRKIVGMISLDSVGLYFDEPATQQGPFPLNLFYPDQGNFLMFVGDFGSRQFVQACVQNFRSQTGFPCEGLTLPDFMPWLAHSDHYAFRKQDWPALLVTDTGPLRNTEYAQMTDTPDRLNYSRMARVTVRLVKLVEVLARRSSSGSLVTN
jgi:hypothetical protein